MASAPIATMDPLGQLSCPDLAPIVAVAVSPSDRSLDEVFGFDVDLRRVGLGLSMLDARTPTAASELVASTTAAVIGRMRSMRTPNDQKYRTVAISAGEVVAEVSSGHIRM